MRGLCSIVSLIFPSKTHPQIIMKTTKKLRATLELNYLQEGISQALGWINAERPLCHNYLEDIDHLFKNCEFTCQIWKTISDYFALTR